MSATLLFPAPFFPTRSKGLAKSIASAWMLRNPFTNNLLISIYATKLRNESIHVIAVLAKSEWRSTGGWPSLSADFSVLQNSGGWPSIRAKVLSRTKNPRRCVSIAIPARDVDDENSGKHLLHLYLGKPGAGTCEKTEFTRPSAT